MSKQPIELSLVKVKVLSKTISHYINPNIVTCTSWDNQCNCKVTKVHPSRGDTHHETQGESRNNAHCVAALIK